MTNILFSNHLISKSEQENRCSWVSKAGFCWDVVEMSSNSMFLPPPKRTPKCSKSIMFVKLCSLWWWILFIFIFIPCKYVFSNHPPSHLYPKYIQIWFHYCCCIFVCSFCMFSLPFFVELPRSSPVASRCCPRCDAMPSLWHGSERIPR